MFLRQIYKVPLDKVRPVLVLTRSGARRILKYVTVAPIVSTSSGRLSELKVGKSNGLGGDAYVSLDNVQTIEARLLDKPIGSLSEEQEKELARIITLAYDLEIFEDNS
ncbi:MAG: type II toxin-antitoxin system PemK/MazF family toxin [Mobiluncus porci]|uniref:type II toxin-antitoxin system PemK/MazF family toxin n=1 Tax=Mobiluncus TaxID=2050 RepID=UPI0023F4A272|nr:MULTISPECIES: type II toxin-antitoxin system PemK/MazF family toxin [Mobiluncus]MDD7541756.1 type II toxin-antitoxin system PemK/MazF family toxin [Mobiluncus porci]MDY5748004.1 type II toxin-antitoxin system PemK/MazF family toxin [Mobiluncus porci]